MYSPLMIAFIYVDNFSKDVIFKITVKGRKYQGDTVDCKSTAYSTPGSIPGRPTIDRLLWLIAIGGSP